MSLRIGVFGGTFDPVHCAHVKLARLAIAECQLQKLILVPCSRPPHRTPALATDRQRLDMLKLATEDVAEIQLCDYELKKNSPSYTVETLDFLRHQYPKEELVFCLGGDSLRALTGWHRWQDILSIAHLAVMERTTPDAEQLAPEVAARVVHCLQEMNSPAGQILRLEAEDLPVSATQIRDRVGKLAAGNTENMAQDKRLAKWLPGAVLNYIVDNKVYQ